MKVAKSIVSTALSIAAAAVFPATSFAGDSKVLPGSNCKPAFGTDAMKVNYTGGAIFNGSNAPVEVRCPIVRDITGNTDGMGAGNGGVYVRIARNNGTAQSVTCRLTAYRAFNSGVVDSSSATLPVNAPQLFDLRLRRSEAGGPFEASCTLPPLYTIQSYQASE